MLYTVKFTFSPLVLVLAGSVLSFALSVAALSVLVALLSVELSPERKEQPTSVIEMMSECHNAYPSFSHSVKPPNFSVWTS